MLYKHAILALVVTVVLQLRLNLWPLSLSPSGVRLLVTLLSTCIFYAHWHLKTMYACSNVYTSLCIPFPHTKLQALLTIQPLPPNSARFGYMNEKPLCPLHTCPLKQHPLYYLWYFSTCLFHLLAYITFFLSSVYSIVSNVLLTNG